jgi:hypothetical protein
MQPTQSQSSYAVAREPFAPHDAQLPEFIDTIRLVAAGEQVPPGAEGSGDTLDDAARGEREDMRQRLREELGRGPSEEELDEWLRQHTEGY